MNVCIILILVILSLCLLSLPNVQYYIIMSVYSNISPTSKDDYSKERKEKSENIFIIKKKFEDIYKNDNLDECNLKRVKTFLYKNIKDKLNVEYLKKLTNDYTIPVLIKNVFDDEFLKKYEFDNITKEYGNVIVEAVLLNETGKVNSIKVPFSEYIKKIDNGEKYYLTVNNSLANVLDINDMLEFYNKIFNVYGLKNIFIGNKHSSTHLHCELASSCAIQIDGIKKWYLIEPKYHKKLHAIPDSKKFFHASSLIFGLK